MVHSGNKIVPVDRVAQRLAFNFPSEKALFAPDARGEVSFRRVCYLSQLLAALCLRVESEHEDACLATIEFRGGAAQKMPMGDDAPEAAAAFVAAARAAVSKGAKPDHVRLAPLPRNFKGVVKVPDLKEGWAKQLAPSK